MIDDDKINRIAADIVERIKIACQPKKIILFGSYAKSKPSEDSDLDILLVTETRIPHEEIYRMRWDLLRDFSIPVQLICMSEQEFIETRDVVGGIAYPASKYGEVLYEKS